MLSHVIIAIKCNLSLSAHLFICRQFPDRCDPRAPPPTVALAVLLREEKVLEINFICLETPN